MPLIAYKCSNDHCFSVFFRKAKEAPALRCCKPDCPEMAKKQLKAPSSTSKVVMDNGVQARAVEINPDIVEINKARSDKDYRED